MKYADSFTLGSDYHHQVIFNRDFGSLPVPWPQWNHAHVESGYISCRSCTCCLMEFKSLGRESCPTDYLKLVSKLKGEYLRLLMA